MEKVSGKSKYLLYLLILLVMTFATFEYANITIYGATCCTFGNQCPPGKGRDPVLRCCAPGPYEANCSADKIYYCREGACP